MNKDNLLYYKLNMPIIPCLIYITTGKDMLARAARRKGLIEEPFVRDHLNYAPEDAGVCVALEGHMLLLILPEEYNVTTVHHEALHAATRMWYDVGANIKVPENDEVLAYTMNYIADYIKEVCYAD